MDVSLFEQPDELIACGILIFYVLAGLGIFFWKTRNWTRDWNILILYLVNRIYAPLMFHWRSNRPCPWPSNEPIIIIANHSSPVDPLLLWMNDKKWNAESSVRPLRFLMAKEYYNLPGIQWIGKTMQSIPVDRSVHDAKPVRQALRILKDNHIVGVFPEGGININHDLKEGSPGVAFLALQAKVPVYPVYVKNSPKSDTMIRCFFKPERVEIIYGEPIDLSAYYGKKKTQELLREVCDYLMVQLAELGGVGYQNSSCEDSDSTETLPMRSRSG